MSETQRDEFSDALAKAALSVGVSRKKLESLIQAEFAPLLQGYDEFPFDVYKPIKSRQPIPLFDLTGVKPKQRDLQLALAELMRHGRLDDVLSLKELSKGRFKLSTDDAQLIYLSLLVGFPQYAPNPEAMEKMVQELGIPFKPKESVVQDYFKGMVKQISNDATFLKDIRDKYRKTTRPGTTEMLIEAIKLLREKTGIAPNPEAVYPDCITLLKKEKLEEFCDVIAALGVPMPEDAIQEEYVRYSRRRTKMGKESGFKLGSFSVFHLYLMTRVMPKEEIYQQTMLDFLHAGDTIFPGQLAFFSGIKARIDEKEVQPMYTQFIREREY